MKAKRCLLGMAFLLIAVEVARGQNSAIADLNVIPQPAAAKYLTGSFTLNNQTKILAANKDSRDVAGLFNDFLLRSYGTRLKLAATKPSSGNYISFTQVGSPSLPEEGYRLAVDPAGIRVVGQPAGLFYGMQTLTQLLPSGRELPVVLPALEISDNPRFRYRGVLLDVGRHFYPVAFIKKFLDEMAQYKINKFQLHLTDDQGWRIEIKKYPKLTEIGSRRKETIKEQHFDPYVGDGIPHEGYYTQEQIKDLVAYAKARFITIIPEIEMPGHAQAALAAYPELACTPGPFEVSTIWGVHREVFCPKEETFNFLENVLSEVMTLFPGPYVHIGGDEVLKDRWKESSDAQAVMKREGLKDENELQSYFIRRIEKFLNSKGKQTIGWDEILQGGLAPNAIVMSWHGDGGAVEAAKQKHEAIMTPYEYCYFDTNQGDPKREPLNIGGFLPLQKVYSYDPVPKELMPEEQKYVLGAQANVWTEYIQTPDSVEYMVFPRLLALAEVLWSPLQAKNYDDFLRRLPYHFVRLEKQNVNYRVPEPKGLKDFYTATDDQAVVQLASLVPGSQIYYTLDGSMPSEKSQSYESPFRVPLQTDQKVFLNVIEVTPGGHRSVVYGATLLRRSFRESANYAAKQRGLAFTVLEGKFASTLDFEKGIRVAAGNTTSLDVKQFGRETNYAVIFAGYLSVPADAFYQFQVESDDGSVLQIDGEEVVSNDGIHGTQMVAGYIPLKQGFHQIELKYFQAGGEAVLGIWWAPAGQKLKPLDGSVLFH